MANYEQQINDWFKTFDERFDKRVPTIIAETATEFYQDRFKTQEWDREAWQPLSPKYNATKSRGRGQILTASGALQRSIRPTVIRRDKVVITAGNATAPYARIHNEGLRVKGVVKVRSHMNRNFMGKGKQVQIKQHNRTMNYQMPRRQFMGHSLFLNTILVRKLLTSFNYDV